MIVLNWFSGSEWKVVTSMMSSKVQPAASSVAPEILERQFDLTSEIRFGYGVGATADLSGNEEEIARTDRG